MENNNYEQITVLALKNLARERGGSSRVTLGLINLS